MPCQTRGGPARQLSLTQAGLRSGGLVFEGGSGIGFLLFGSLSDASLLPPRKVEVRVGGTESLVPCWRES